SPGQTKWRAQTFGTFPDPFGAVEGESANVFSIYLTYATGTPVNQAPVVSAGSNQTITFPAAANLAGTASDDGLPNPPGSLTTTWSKLSGPGTVNFANASALNTTATFSSTGTYVLQLSASDSALSSSGTVTITVQASGSTAILGDSNVEPI